MSTARGKAVVQNLDDDGRDPSGADYQIQLLGCCYTYESTWDEFIFSQEPPLIRNPQHDPQAPSDARDPLGLFDIGTDNGDGTITPIAANEKLDLGSKFFIDRVVVFTSSWVAQYEANSTPVEAAAYLRTAKENQAAKGRQIANRVYSQVSPDEGAQTQGRGRKKR